MDILTSGVISQICNAITMADTGLKIAKSVPTYKYFWNKCLPSIKIAVFGESGSGKSSFLESLRDGSYIGGSTRITDTVSIRLRNGRKVEFTDCPGQASYRVERQRVKAKIMTAKYHAIINVVCYGYNESDHSSLPKFNTGSDEVSETYLNSNKDREIVRLDEWIKDINSDTKIKWVLTLVNKADLWGANDLAVMDYYKTGTYGTHFKPLEGFCQVHAIPYCSKISLFDKKPIKTYIDEDSKAKLKVNLLNNIEKFVTHAR